LAAVIDHGFIREAVTKPRAVVHNQTDKPKPLSLRAFPKYQHLSEAERFGCPSNGLGFKPTKLLFTTLHPPSSSSKPGAESPRDAEKGLRGLINFRPARSHETSFPHCRFNK
jgi:hypothetical protein